MRSAYVAYGIRSASRALCLRREGDLLEDVAGCGGGACQQEPPAIRQRRDGPARGRQCARRVIPRAVRSPIA